jgi:hypothetical protein
MWISYPHRVRQPERLVYRGWFFEGWEAEIRSYPLIHSPYYCYFIYLVINLYRDNSNRGVDKWITLPMAEARRKRRLVGRKSQREPGISAMAGNKFFSRTFFASILEGSWNSEASI